MFKILIYCFVFFVCLFDAQAMSLTPFIHSFAPTKEEDTIEYEITNKMDQPVAFAVSIFRRKLDKKGDDLLKEDEDSFVLYPPQVIIPATSSRRIKVKWIGNKDFEQQQDVEQAYRVVFEQFPMDFTKKQAKNTSASIKIRVKLVASLYMTPKSAKPMLITDKVTCNGSNYMVSIINNGTKRAILSKMDGEIIDVNGSGYILKDLLSQDDIEGVILAGQTREFNVTASKLKTSIKVPLLNKKKK